MLSRFINIGQFYYDFDGVSDVNELDDIIEFYLAGMYLVRTVCEHPDL